MFDISFSVTVCCQDSCFVYVLRDNIFVKFSLEEFHNVSKFFYVQKIDILSARMSDFFGF